jgi:hypothetical protein
MELKYRLRNLGVGLFLAAFLIWPAFHAILAVRYTWNPWKFYGLAMYTTPQLSYRVFAYEPLEQGEREIGLSAFEATLLTELADIAGHVGQNLDVTPIARIYLDARPGLAGIRFEYREFVLRSTTDRIGMRYYFWDVGHRPDGGLDVYFSRDELGVDEIILDEAARQAVRERREANRAPD